jgi:hypothetical protein
MFQGPCAHLGFKCWDMGIVAWVMTNVVLDDWWPHTKLEHSRSNSNKTNQLVLAKLEHCKSNSNKTSQLGNMVWTLTSVPLKSRSNQKPRYYVMYPCTYDKNLEMIQPLVHELQHFLCFWHLLAKPRSRSDRNLVCEVRWPRGTYVQSFKSVAPVVTERTSVTVKSRSNQKPGYYVMYPY